MVETRRSSASSKRPLTTTSSSLPSGKRSKAPSSTNDALPGAIVGSMKKSLRESVNQEAQSDDQTGVGDARSSDMAAPGKLDVGQVAATDAEKAKSNGTLLNRGKKQQLKSNAGVAWGRLLSQCSQNPHVVMNRPIFTVGQGRHCDLSVGDPSRSKSLCRLKHTQSEMSHVLIYFIYSITMHREAAQTLYLRLLGKRVLSK